MLKHKITSTVIVSTLFLSMSFNILFIAVELSQRNLRQNYWEMLNINSPLQTDVTSFHNYVLQGSIRILTDGIDIPRPQQYSSFKDNLTEFLSKKEKGFNKGVYRYCDTAFLLNSLLFQAKTLKDNELILFVRKMFDEYELSLPPMKEEKTLDRVPYGLVAIELYLHTKDEKYKRFADEEYQWLKSIDTTEVGIIYDFRDSTRNHQAVEAPGFVCSFLMQYAKAFNDDEAREMAVNQLNLYCEKGCDMRSGLPAADWRIFPPYNTTGNHHWGRGNTWFSIGVLAVDEKDLSPQAQNIIKKYLYTLSDIYRRNKCFHQFIDEPRSPRDMCAELPLIYLLYKKGLVQLKKEDLLEYSRFMKDGIIYHSSGVFPYHGGPVTIVGSSNRLSQAYLLQLLNEVQ